MFPSILILAVSAVGVTYGYEPLPEGGMKYIVQFEPEALAEAERQGLPIESYIPAKVSDVRAISIRLGAGPLPREDAPAQTDRHSGTDDGPPLLQSAQGKPLASPTSFNGSKETAKGGKEAAAPTTADALAKPWPLIGVSIAFFASLGGNFYLGWIYAELRKRYRTLLRTDH
jgi:hypothetical protein